MGNLSDFHPFLFPCLLLRLFLDILGKKNEEGPCGGHGGGVYGFCGLWDEDHHHYPGCCLPHKTQS